jgi:hypothetical protein
MTQRAPERRSGDFSFREVPFMSLEFDEQLSHLQKPSRDYTNRWVSTIEPVSNPGHYSHNR